jgi:hypothetical protein
MLTPTVGLTGVYSFVAGDSDGGHAIDMAYGMAVNWWPAARVSLGAGPAMVLASRPGFTDWHLAPGATGSASLAIVRAGTFVLDLRLDLTVAPSDAFGILGIGVNMN